MTTKQIADAAGVSIDTVARKIKELYPESVSKGKTTNLHQKQAIIVMGELRKLNFVQPTQNADVPTQNADARMDRLESMMEKLLGIVAAMIPQQSRLAIAAPPMEPRAELRKIIAAAARNSGDYSGTWGTLYQEAFYRLNVNLRERAKNRGVETLTYAESEGFLPELVAIARKVFQP